MISETEFAELGNSLSTGFFVDKVVMALARTERLGGYLQAQDRPTIEEARRLLEQVQRGERLLDEKKFDTYSAESALAFDRAVHALPHIRVPREFAEHIKHLEGIINTLLQKGAALNREVEEVRVFFSRYGRWVFVEAQKIIIRPGAPQEVQLWTQRE